MKSPARIFVTGVTGSIGRQLAVAAAAAGYPVRGLALAGEDVDALEAHGIEIRRGSLEDPGSLDSASEGTTHAVHCAALLPHLSHLGREAFQRVNVDGARALAQLASRRGWKRVVFVSTCGVLGREKSGPTTDATSYREPFDLYTWSKIEAEKAVLQETGRTGVPSVLLRPTNVYGAGMLFKWPELFELVRDGRMKLIDGGQAPFSVIHVRDLVRAILASLDEGRPLAPGERILIASGEELTFADVIDAVALALKAPRAGSLPYAVALSAAFVARALPPPLRLGRLKLLTPAAVREYRQGFRFDTGHGERVLGFRAQEQFRPGIEEAIAAWRARV